MPTRHFWVSPLIISAYYQAEQLLFSLFRPAAH
jgi:hypothetical protein